jgi:hypothetical protein
VQAWYDTGNMKALNQAITKAENNYSNLGAKITMAFTGDNPVWKVVLSGESRCMVEDVNGPSVVFHPTSCSNY